MSLRFSHDAESNGNKGKLEIGPGFIQGLGFKVYSSYMDYSQIPHMVNEDGGLLSRDYTKLPARSPYPHPLWPIAAPNPDSNSYEDFTGYHLGFRGRSLH